MRRLPVRATQRSLYLEGGHDILSPVHAITPDGLSIDHVPCRYGGPEFSDRRGSGAAVGYGLCARARNIDCDNCGADLIGIKMVVTIKCVKRYIIEWRNSYITREIISAGVIDSRLV